MNFSFTLTPDEILRRHQRPRRPFLSNERIDAAIGVPTRRDVVDHDNVTWRIEFTSKHVADASPVGYPDGLPQIASVMWIRSDSDMDSIEQTLPWSGLAHVTTDMLRDWLASERTQRESVTRSA